MNETREIAREIPTQDMFLKPANILKGERPIPPPEISFEDQQKKREQDLAEAIRLAQDGFGIDFHYFCRENDISFDSPIAKAGLSVLLKRAEEAEARMARYRQEYEQERAALAVDLEKEKEEILGVMATRSYPTFSERSEGLVGGLQDYFDAFAGYDLVDQVFWDPDVKMRMKKKYPEHERPRSEGDPAIFAGARITQTIVLPLVRKSSPEVSFKYQLDRSFVSQETQTALDGWEKLPFPLVTTKYDPLGIQTVVEDLFNRHKEIIHKGFSIEEKRKREWSRKRWQVAQDVFSERGEEDKVRAARAFQERQDRETGKSRSDIKKEIASGPEWFIDKMKEAIYHYLGEVYGDKVPNELEVFKFIKENRDQITADSQEALMVFADCKAIEEQLERKYEDEGFTKHDFRQRREIPNLVGINEFNIRCAQEKVAHKAAALLDGISKESPTLRFLLGGFQFIHLRVVDKEYLTISGGVLKTGEMSNAQALARHKTHEAGASIEEIAASLKMDHNKPFLILDIPKTGEIDDKNLAIAALLTALHEVGHSWENVLKPNARAEINANLKKEAEMRALHRKLIDFGLSETSLPFKDNLWSSRIGTFDKEQILADVVACVLTSRIPSLNEKLAESDKLKALKTDPLFRLVNRLMDESDQWINRNMMEAKGK